jgi:hypothetical protein
MADCGEDYAAPAEIVGPARNSLSAQVFTFVDVSQAIDILTPQEDVLRIFVIRDEMLFVVHYEILDATRDWVFLIHDRHLERAQGWMIDVRPTHHLPIVLGRKRNVAAVVQGVQRTPSLHEASDGCTLVLGDPGLGLLLRPVSVIFKHVRVFVVVGLEISIGPDHSIAQNHKQAVGRQQARGYLIVVDGVIDPQIQLSENSVQGNANIVGVVITVADEGKNTRTAVIGGEGTAAFSGIQENSSRC